MDSISNKELITFDDLSLSRKYKLLVSDLHNVARQYNELVASSNAEIKKRNKYIHELMQLNKALREKVEELQKSYNNENNRNGFDVGYDDSHIDGM